MTCWISMKGLSGPGVKPAMELGFMQRGRKSAGVRVSFPDRGEREKEKERKREMRERER